MGKKWKVERGQEAFTWKKALVQFNLMAS